MSEVFVWLLLLVCGVFSLAIVALIAEYFLIKYIYKQNDAENNKATLGEGTGSDTYPAKLVQELQTGGKKDHNQPGSV